MANESDELKADFINIFCRGKSLEPIENPTENFETDSENFDPQLVEKVRILTRSAARRNQNTNSDNHSSSSAGESKTGRRQEQTPDERRIIELEDQTLEANEITDPNKYLTRAQLQGMAEQTISKRSELSPLGRAQAVHQELHLQAKELREQFEISRSEAQSIVTSCLQCSNAPQPNNHIRCTYHFKKPSNPRQRVFMDAFEFRGDNIKTTFMLFVDQFTEEIFIQPMQNLRVGSVLDSIFKTFASSYLPAIILCDNYASFRSPSLIDKLSKFGVTIQSSAAYRSNSNYAERFIRTCKNYLRRSPENVTSAEYLYKLHVTLNCVKNNRLGIPPYQTCQSFAIDTERILGFRLGDITDAPRAFDFNFENTFRNNEKHNRKCDQVAKQTFTKIVKNFAPGDLIRYKKFGKKDNTLIGQGSIIKIDDFDIVIQDENGGTIIRHCEDVFSNPNAPFSAKTRRRLQHLNRAKARHTRRTPARQKTRQPLA